MQIKILDSWLREHLKTKAKPSEIAKILSLTSVSVERIEKFGEDFVYDIEITTNRVDLMSVVGIAKEASATLSANGFPSDFVPLKLPKPSGKIDKFPIEIKNDPEIVSRVCAAVLEVEIKESPSVIKNRLEASGIRSLNNLIDITNYVMREIGHPTHVFDFNRLNTKNLIIRKSRKGEIVKTLDDKTHTLSGGDIVAENDKGEIVDLLGVMGTANSVVNSDTKRILFFIDNNNPRNIRNTSMNQAIRTEAAIINEKGVDPNLAMDAMYRGIELFEDIADGRIVSSIIDIYPNKPSSKSVNVSFQKINDVIGVEIPKEKSEHILRSLGFEVSVSGQNLITVVPSQRSSDISIEEDIIEEIARVWGFEKLPAILPDFSSTRPYKFDSEFYFERRLKSAMKYLGFSEVYTYSMVSEEMFEGPLENAVKIKNPLSEDMTYMRSSLTPSLLSALSENKKRGEVKIFEIANVYDKRADSLPEERLTFAGVLKSKALSFFNVKGLIEAVLSDLGLSDLKFKEKEDGEGAEIYKGSVKLGYVEAYDDTTYDFELDFEKILSFANLKKTYKPLAKFPPIIEDISFEIKEGVSTENIVEEIKKQSHLISEVSLLDEYGGSKTFHIIYQDPEKNLTSGEIAKIREKIIRAILGKYATKVK